ncbi:hypothetical protein B0H16DRAFT_1457602 [Mycena metata]|uniref:Uncharacterized protein n=1 Tax=Mycena metata TaxID=1033252 RepID=A0AAD7NDZ8_9AGAR|nr:hypothetical protein B0H16DRAFT_1457602 [Mycena metata]
MTVGSALGHITDYSGISGILPTHCDSTSTRVSRNIREESGIGWNIFYEFTRQLQPWELLTFDASFHMKVSFYGLYLRGSLYLNFPEFFVILFSWPVRSINALKRAFHFSLLRLHFWALLGFETPDAYSLALLYPETEDCSLYTLKPLAASTLELASPAPIPKTTKKIAQLSFNAGPRPDSNERLANSFWLSSIVRECGPPLLGRSYLVDNINLMTLPSLPRPWLCRRSSSNAKKFLLFFRRSLLPTSSIEQICASRTTDEKRFLLLTQGPCSIRTSNSHNMSVSLAIGPGSIRTSNSQVVNATQEFKV